MFSIHSLPTYPSNSLATSSDNLHTHTRLPYKDCQPSLCYPSSRSLHRAYQKHLTRRPPQDLGRPDRTADHEAMPAIASLHDIERARFQPPGTVQHHLDGLRRQSRPVPLPNHVRRGDVAPSGVRLLAGVHAEALMGELRGPGVCFGRGGGWGGDRGRRSFWRPPGRRSRFPSGHRENSVLVNW